MPHRNLALLASLFPEPQDPLRLLFLEIPAPQPRDGSHPHPGVGQHAQHGPIPQPHRVREVQGTEQCPRLPGGQLRRLAVHHGVLLAPHGGKGVQRHGMARHQGVEEVTQGGQGQIPGGVRSGQLLDKTPGQPRRDLAQLDPLLLAPSQKAPHGTGIGAAGVGVGDLGREELVSGEAGILPGPLQEGREGIGQGGGGGVLK